MKLVAQYGGVVSVDTTIQLTQNNLMKNQMQRHGRSPLRIGLSIVFFGKGRIEI